MRPRFLLDEMISPRVALEARRAGLDILAVAGSGRAGQEDRAVFRAAIGERRVLVTYNVADFMRIFGDLLKEGIDVPGVVFVSRKGFPTSDPGALLKGLLRLSRRIEEGEVDPASGVFLER